jgi:hypothetical protein
MAYWKNVFTNRRRTRLKLACWDGNGVLLCRRRLHRGFQELTHELAYYTRIQFGKKSEALTGEQRELFEKTVGADLAPMEDELPGLQGKAPRPARQRAGRQPRPPELPRIEQERGGRCAPPSRACWPQRSSMGSIRWNGRPAHWELSRRAPTARSTPSYHSCTLSRAKRLRKVGRLDAYQV